MAFALGEKICVFLLSKKLVSKNDLNKAKQKFSKEGGNLGDILIEMNVISKEDLFAAITETIPFPPIKLVRLKIEKKILELIPEKVSRMYQILPVSRIGKQLTVAMVDPLNIFALDDLKILTHLNISPVIASADDMVEAIRKHYEKSADEEINEIVKGIKSSDMEMVTEEKGAKISTKDLLNETSDAPIVKLANMILNKAVKERASDILIEPMEKKSRVRFRIDGLLCEYYNPPKKFHQAIISRIKVMSNLDISERRLPQDGRFKIKVANRKIDFRVSIVPSSFGEKAALRILDKAQATIDIERLGFNERDKEKIRSAADEPYGMILISGPTGCGKTTTLYSILKYADDPEKNIITVEDPVEFEIKGINQVNVNEEVGLTFQKCLRSILRQDPDIIMVGEIRDFETLDVAVKSALTGHLVLSTLHTNTAAGSIVRMINMGVEPFLISAAVQLIGAQRLLRTLCPECKEAYTPPKEIVEKYKLFDKKNKTGKIYRARGCKHCMNTGYRGRLGIIECIRLTPAVKELIASRAGESDIERTARKEGMISLRENGIENVLEGKVSLEDVLAATID
ncbi:MAG: Flp pilus assembly complex ATPase component TadA [Candidatus Omnitrophica bacterium]|nr:Flp pilus assembly complex ATPase component TadA [Candidatus Omnitrophota bacterium]